MTYDAQSEAHRTRSTAYGLLTLLLFVIAGIVAGCGEKGKSSETNGAAQESAATSQDAESSVSADATRELPEGLSVYPGAPLRKSPGGDGEYVTRLNLGETFRHLGATEQASLRGKPRTYTKVRLAGETEGWVREDMIAIDAKPGAILRETSLHERPTPMATTDEKFQKMDVVAVLDSNGSWAQVRGVRRGESWWDEGWVRLNEVTRDDKNVAVAALWKKAQQKEDEAERRAAVKKIVNNPSFEGSVFINSLSAQLPVKNSVKKYVREDEVLIFSAELENGTTVAVVREKNGAYLKYRYGKKGEFKGEYPETEEDTWSKFTYYGKRPEGSDYEGEHYLNFVPDPTFEYVLYTNTNAPVGTGDRCGLKEIDSRNGEVAWLTCEERIQGSLAKLEELDELEKAGPRPPDW